MDDPSAIAQSAVPRMVRPVLAVRPFVSEDGPDWIGKALADDILNELVRRGRFEALSRHTSFAEATDEDALRCLGADAVIEGKLTDERLLLTLSRIGAQKAAITLRNHGIGALQGLADEAADRLLAELGGPLDLAAHLAPGPRAAVPPDAHAGCLHAFEAVWTFTPDGNATALALLEGLDGLRSCALVPAMRAWLTVRGYRSGWISDRGAVAATVSAALDAAREGWSDDPRLLWTTAFAEAMLLRRYPVAADLTRRAALAQPHVSPALTWGALFLSYNLDFDGALAMARRAMRISPQDPMRVTQSFAGALAAIHGGRDREAQELCDLGLDRSPAMVNLLRIKAVAQAHLGDHEGARDTMKTLLGIAPNETKALIARVNPLREWSGFSRFLDGLEIAGMP